MRTTRAYIALILLGAAAFGPASAQAPGSTIWSGIIPDAFPGIEYTWTLQEGGTYVEDGVWRASGTSTQEPLTGRWTSSTDILVLQQDSLGFVLHGVVEGNWFSGELYQQGRVVGKFCARKGDEVPTSCDASGLVS